MLLRGHGVFFMLLFSYFKPSVFKFVQPSIEISISFLSMSRTSLHDCISRRSYSRFVVCGGSRERGTTAMSHGWSSLATPIAKEKTMEIFVCAVGCG